METRTWGLIGRTWSLWGGGGGWVEGHIAPITLSSSFVSLSFCFLAAMRWTALLHGTILRQTALLLHIILCPCCFTSPQQWNTTAMHYTIFWHNNNEWLTQGPCPWSQVRCIPSGLWCWPSGVIWTPVFWSAKQRICHTEHGCVKHTEQRIITDSIF